MYKLQTSRMWLQCKHVQFLVDTLQTADSARCTATLLELTAVTWKFADYLTDGFIFYYTKKMCRRGVPLFQHCRNANTFVKHFECVNTNEYSLSVSVSPSFTCSTA